MKTINIFALIMLSLFVSCGTTQKMPTKISQKLCKKNITFYNTKEAKKSEKNANYVRKKLIKKGYLNFLSQGTVFYMIEGYSIEDSDVFTAMWNEKGRLSFIFDEKLKSYQLETVLFSKELKNLVSNWNLSEIRRLQHKRGVFTNAQSITILKATLYKGNIMKIKRFSFSEYVGVMQSQMQFLKQY